MEMIICPNCNKLTGYKRAIGFGTFFAVLITLGLWLFVLPFYPKRCIICGLTKSASVPWHQTWKRAALIAFVGLLLIAALSRRRETSDGPAATTADLSAATPVQQTSPDPPVSTHEERMRDLLSRQEMNNLFIAEVPRTIDAARLKYGDQYVQGQLNEMYKERDELRRAIAEERARDNDRPAWRARGQRPQSLRPFTPDSSPVQHDTVQSNTIPQAPGIDAGQRDQIWQTIQAWAHSIEIADLDQFRTFYADQLEQYYGKANVALSDVVQTMAPKVRNYTTLKLRASNPSFRQVAPNLAQVDYDKQYEFTGPNARPNEGETKSSLRLVSTGGKWSIVAEFDRQICWSTLMHNPALQSPPGRCQ